METFYRRRPEKPGHEQILCKCGFVNLHSEDDFVFSFREHPNRIHRKEKCGEFAVQSPEEPFDPQEAR